MKVMPYDPSHEEAYNAFIMKTEPKTEVFFLQNLPKPTDRKHFETVTTLLTSLWPPNVIRQAIIFFALWFVSFFFFFSFLA